MSRIRDLERERPLNAEASDICIVGAGAAGILLAVELLRLGKRVMLLEAGGADVEEASQEPYRSQVIGLPHQGVHTGRFRAKGGTTTRWGGQILEFDEADFARRPGVQGSGWPFAKAELTPFYARALELEGIPKTLRQDTEVWQSLGMTPPQFNDLDPYFSRWLPEPNFARLHAGTLEGHPHLDVWLHANAVDLLLDGEQAVGVHCRTLGGVEATFTAREYVFCLGGIESSRFFLQPREGQLPWNRSGLLGRHYQDHIDSNAAEIVPRNPGRFHELFDNVFLHGLKYHPKLRLASAVQRERGTLNVAATMLFLSGLDEATAAIKATAKHLLRGRLREVQGGDLARLAANLPLLLRQSYRYAVQHRAYNPPDARILLRVHCEQEPLSESNITLSGERDSLGLLRTRLDWRIADRELETIRTFVQVATASLNSLAEVRPDPDLLAGSRAYVARCDDSLHHMGGMRMAVSEREGVVDPNLRLHGTRNAFVCSAAVFPTSGYSNPTHTLLALAMRLAEHLR